MVTQVNTSIISTDIFIVLSSLTHQPHIDYIVKGRRSLIVDSTSINSTVLLTYSLQKERGVIVAKNGVARSSK